MPKNGLQRKLYAVPVTLQVHAVDEAEAAAYVESMLDFFFRAARDAEAFPGVWEVHENENDILEIREGSAGGE